MLFNINFNKISKGTKNECYGQELLVFITNKIC